MQAPRQSSLMSMVTSWDVACVALIALYELSYITAEEKATPAAAPASSQLLLCTEGPASYSSKRRKELKKKHLWPRGNAGTVHGGHDIKWTRKGMGTLRHVSIDIFLARQIYHERRQALAPYPTI